MGTTRFRRHFTAAAALCSALAVLCDCAHRSEPLAPGFYRHADNPTVYKVAADAPPCVVSDMAQLTILGGLRSVRVVEPAVSIAPEGKLPDQCAWPAGYYQIGSSNEIYRIADFKGCTAKRVPPGVTPFLISTRGDLQGITIVGSCS